MRARRSNREAILRRSSWLGPRVRSPLITWFAGCALAAPAFALDCPDPQTIASRGVLQETPAEIEATGKILASGDPEKKMIGVLADLRARYPKVDDAELANYLITPIVP